jgi:chromosomal replication initiation ATPase DnaA
MIIEIKIKSFPGNSMIRLLTSIKILTNLAKKFGFDIEVKKYSEVKSNLEKLEAIVCSEMEKFLNEKTDPLSLKRRTRKRNIVYSRQIVMRHMMNGSSSITAGKRYNLDHTTALHAFATVNNMADTNRHYMQMIRTIECLANVKIL